MHALRSLALVALALAACSDSDASDAGGDTSADVGPPDSAADAATDATDDGADSVDPCGGCATGKRCCPSRFDGDIPRCVDPLLNPENCGTCGTLCGGACSGGACIDAPECRVGESCADALVCSGQGVMGRCCPVGTTFIASPADFFGCCPDGDICGCRQGMCPISVRAAKREIRYLDAEALAALGRELLATRLATYHYTGAPAERRQLGFIIDDGAPAHGIAADGGHVDLYGYVSLAVAALQTQARELETLRRELDELRARLDALAVATRPVSPTTQDGNAGSRPEPGPGRSAPSWGRLGQ